ncbi:hypothetical protein [Blautia hansenii]|uniref:DnaJ domain protein n=1 Tax=Blautia hansenii DSM 20583 TaxID=537007 RepID=C9L7Z5_BLAHA|nr:hypothetical protein [Blautia hansenii]ASM69707.1 hypothetical protein CGC63_09165 [Blautia hansenii DSM 20583]EEX21890.1 hypothetical protein BLAHAN_05518 [Blautia hansenii DSM 20583]UWO09454.1 hypothetical protein NQ538_09165 [Blautia hansenii DSM 20583]
MAYIIIIPLALLLLTSFCRLSSLTGQIKKQERQKDDWQMLAEDAEREAARLRSGYNFYYDNYARLSKQLEQLKEQMNRQNDTYNSCNSQINNQEIIEAVKYAMKKSHPDNGGNAEDFKKYRELYNRIK